MPLHRMGMPLECKVTYVLEGTRRHYKINQNVFKFQDLLFFLFFSTFSLSSISVHSTPSSLLFWLPSRRYYHEWSAPCRNHCHPLYLLLLLFSWNPASRWSDEREHTVPNIGLISKLQLQLIPQSNFWIVAVEVWNGCNSKDFQLHNDNWVVKLEELGFSVHFFLKGKTKWALSCLLSRWMKYMNSFVCGEIQNDEWFFFTSHWVDFV